MILCLMKEIFLKRKTERWSDEKWTLGQNFMKMREPNRFVDDMMKKLPKDIISAAYEKVMRDDILMIFENEDLPDNHIKVLLKLKY